MLISAILLSWLTYLYYPINEVLIQHSGLFRSMIIAVSSIRLFMMILTVKKYSSVTADV
jgi:hypothetical protein